MKIPEESFQCFNAVCVVYRQNCSFFTGDVKTSVYGYGNDYCPYARFCRFSIKKLSVIGYNLTETLYKKLILIAQIEGHI